MGGSGRGLPVVVGIAVMALSAVTDAAPLPEPKLRLDAALRAKPAVSSSERSVLRVEWQAGQSRADEGVAIDDMLTRLERMGHSLAELRAAVNAIPANRTGEPSPSASAGGGDEALPWMPVAGGVAVLAAAGIFWRRRRRGEMSDQLLRPELLAPPTPATPRSPVSNAPEKASAKAKAQGTEKSETSPPPSATGAGDGSTGAPPPGLEIDLIPTLAPLPPPDFDIHPIAEADDALELVEIMVSMGLNQGAAQTLEEQIRLNPRRALYHWLKLLDIYRRAGQQVEFDRAARELNQCFNVKIPQWADQTAHRASLEDYPHVVGRLQELWPLPGSCMAYLTRLLEDNRGGTRIGFPQPVVEDVLLLLSLLRH